MMALVQTELKTDSSKKQESISCSHKEQISNFLRRNPK
jgi:hypothetical protein